MHGPNPKPPSKRRRRTPPASYGAAHPTSGPAAALQPPGLGFDGPVHQLVVDMWSALGESVEAKFFSKADWQRARLELWFANSHMTSGAPITAAAWSTIQNGLSALLISPADKRRAGIEMRSATADADEEAAILTMVRYREKLKP